MNEKLTTKQRDWIYNYFYDVMSLDTFVGRVASLENFLTTHPAEDEDMCQCFTCQGSGKWAAGCCPDSENPAHTEPEDERHDCIKHLRQLGWNVTEPAEYDGLTGKYLKGDLSKANPVAIKPKTEDEVLAECGRCGRTGFETDEEIAKRMIEACIEIYRKKYNTLYTTPTLGEVMNWLQREET